MGKFEFRVDREVKPAMENGKRKAPTRSKNSYAGGFYNLNVLVDEDVYLSALEFFGPAKKEEADYEILAVVKVKIDEPNVVVGCIASCGIPFFRDEAIIPTCRGSIKGVKKGTTFKLPFPKPVLLEKGQRYVVQFQLNGPETEQMKVYEHTIEVEMEPGQGRNAKFTCSGTRQIPNLYFQVP